MDLCLQMLIGFRTLRTETIPKQILSESKIMLIKELYDDVSEIHGDSLAPLELWYNEMINKRIDELSILDISRMLRQNELLDTFKRLIS